MSLTLATVADALIEFILSLLRDPDVAAEFDDDPEQALISRGLNHASASDVAAVAPVIIERTHVVQMAAPRRVVESDSHPNPVVREIKHVVSNNQWVDDRDTIVDQSVNQNIWAEGDVTQSFDNDAIVASGDDAVAAGKDAIIDKTHDQSTTIEAGEDVNIGNDTDVEVVEDSFNEDSDTSETTDESVQVIIEDSLDDASETVTVDDSFNEETTVTEATETTIAENVVSDADGAVIVEEAAPADQQPAQEQPAVEEAPTEELLPYDSAVEYVESAIETDTGVEFDSGDSMAALEVESDENF